MSIGRFLDDAEGALRRADSRMRAITSPSSAEVIEVAATRDQLYRQLDRFLNSFARTEGPRRPTMSDATALLGEQYEGIPRAYVLAAGIKAATLGLMDPAPSHESSRGRVTAAPIAVAVESVSLAAEIVATHLHPPIAGVTSGWSWPDTARHLTREATALTRGAQRPEGVGEVARLTLAAMQIDRQLLAWQVVQPQPLLPDQWDHLRQWTGSGFTAELRAMAAAEPALLLRHLQPAPAIDRTTGPRDITSWTDAVAAVTAARSAIQRQPSQATIAVTRAAARLGFAATAAGWRLSGDDQPPPQVAADGKRWTMLAAALSKVADVRDTIAPELALELDHAGTWIKQRVSGPAPSSTLAELGALIELQQETQRLCGDLRRHLSQARVVGDLLTGVRRLDTTSSSGPIAVAVQAWDRARIDDPWVAAMMDRLEDVAALSVSVPLGGVLRQATAASFGSGATASVAAEPVKAGQLVSAAKNGHSR